MKEVEILTAQTSGFFGTQLIMIFGFILLLYFLLIRPQNKRLKAHQELVNNLEIGDEVITSGGIVCTLVKLTDSYVTARTGNNQEIVIQRQQINSVLPKGTVKSLFE
ncbi:MAG: preprotein translocase subunit YajC [Gammaproteobacteria bacterium]|nr:preprotein translocase subunit YajC [Gammaproteobacteria bacterium]|tara:strand:- start:4550 stop:4870 length:321 start_codon:yes stop_codon:yes gene_type:complete